MKKYFYSLFIATLCFVSCTESDDFAYSTKEEVTSHKLTAAEAASNVMDFISKMNSSSRSGNTLSVSDVEAVTLPTVSSSRASSSATDTLFYIVNFDGDNGYAIAAADDRETKIYALIEKGHFSLNDPTAVGFNMFMSSLINMKLRGTLSETPPDTDDHPGDDPDDADREHEGDRVGGGPGISTEVMRPLLNTQWGQRDWFATYCSTRYTGCVPTAISQICSYLHTPTYIPVESVNIETFISWTTINEECRNSDNGQPTSEEAKRQVALLMRYWGEQFNANYTDSITLVDPDIIIDVLRSLYLYDVSRLVDYDVDRVIDDLKAGDRIILMRGNTGRNYTWLVFPIYTGGHAWVVDGYIREYNFANHTDYIHCNWGNNGDNNGYYHSGVLDSGEGPVYTSRSEHYYQYHLQTATFKKTLGN